MERQEPLLDPTLYEPIDGREVLRRIADGLEFFSARETRYFFDENGIFSEQKVGKPYADFGQLPVSVVLGGTWYIRRAFNVREQLVRRPNEWVGKFKRHGGWYVVRFDTESMRVVRARLSSDTAVGIGTYPKRYGDVRAEDLNDCIPLNYVRPSREVNTK